MSEAEVYVFPMTPQQRRLWVLDRLRPGDPAYNVPLALRLRGAVRVEVLQEALATLIERHEILRTTFGELNGEFVQLIHTSTTFASAQSDLTHLDEDTFAQRLADESRQPFDLIRGPLLRAHLFRRAPSEYLLFINLHHIVCDRWSLGILAREVMAAYNAGVTGSGAVLEAPEYQYADYADWLGEALPPGRVSEHVAYWRQALAGLPPTWRLPRTAVRSGGGAVARALPRDLVERTAVFARKLGATPFMPLLAIFAALLRRYEAGDDLPIATPVANRDQSEFAGTIGFFVNTLIIRVDCAGMPSLQELTEKVRDRCLAAYAHQELPFDVLIQELRPERTEDGRSPLFQAMFALQNTPMAPLRLAELEVIPVPISTGGLKNDLTLIMEYAEDGSLQATLEFDQGLFTHSQAAAFLDHYARLLEAAVTTPTAPLWQLPLLSAEDRWQVTAGAHPHAHVPEARTLVAWFEEVAARFADQPALCDTEGRVLLDYRGLDAQANRLARRLRQLGMNAESPVGLCLEREPELVVAILAVLKAGGCYVPLDPRYPPERQALLVADSEVQIVLTKAALAHTLHGCRARVLLLDDVEEMAAIAAHASDALGLAIDPGQAAYVIYTSGSTGRPKGCVVEHRNVTALMAAAQRHFDFGPEDVWTLFHSYAFDFSVWEIWGALLHGGRVVIVPYWVSRSPDAFAAAVRDCGVTVLNQTPSAFRQMMELLAAQGHALRFVIFGGEALQTQSLASWYRRHVDDAPRLVNMYGITETTVHVTYRVLGRVDTGDGVGSIIGQPLDHLQLYVLDEFLQPVPAGVTGEIYVGGAGVSRGYLRQPGLTAQRFLPDPFSTMPGARLYRSGDLARRLPDGSLEYLGRADQQLKIRGFRIEPGEIQAALCTHTDVAEALVLAVDGPDRDKRLVAYIVAPHRAPGTDELRAFLLERLPEHMVPQVFVALAAFPLNHHGKIDRAALPAADERGVSAGPHVAPRTDTEQRLAAIWEQVLRVPQVGATDNFFASGGDSILALQVVSRARKAGIHITPRQIFEHQSVAALAQAAAVSAESSDDADSESSLTPIQHWFFQQDLADAHHWNQSIVLELDPAPPPERLALALAALARQHSALRLRFAQTPAGWRQQVAQTGEFFPLALHDDGDVQAAAIAVQSRLDLVAGPVAAAALVTTPGTLSARLVLAIHHLVVDGVSWRILADDLGDLVRDPDTKLPATAVSFPGWAARLAKEAVRPRTEAELAYWLGVGAGHAARLPRDSDGDNTEAGAETFSVTLDEPTTERLLRSGPQAQRATVHEILVAALAVVMGEVAGGRLVIAMESQGREEIESGLDLSRTVGWFTSLYPFCLPELPDRGFTGARIIRLAKESVRAVPRNGIGYGLLRYLHPDAKVRDELASLPAPELSFNYLGQIADSDQEGMHLVSSVQLPERGGRNRRPFAVDVNALVIGGQLRLSWVFHPALHRRETICDWAERLYDRLRSLIDASVAEARVPSPADYPLAVLDERTLHALLARYPGAEDIRTLSPMQQGMLFHSVDGGESGLYVEQLTGIIRGDLDGHAFAGAWNDVIARHEILRSAMEWRAGGMPCQVVLARARIQVSEIDWRDVPRADLDARLAAFLTEDRARGLSLDEPPLMRISLMRIEDRQWRWVWTHHHIVLDGWSLPILFDEVMRAYEARVEQRTLSLPRPVDYAAYLRWLAQRSSEESAEFWRSWLEGVTAPQRIDGGRGLDELREPAGEIDIPLNHDERGRLEAFARAEGITLNTLLLGAWLLVLRSHGAGPNPLVGVTVAGRPSDLPEAERMVGLFINTLPLAHVVEPTVSVGSWLRSLQNRQAQLREAEHCRLVDIRRWVGWEADTQLFESLFVFENYPVSETLRRAAGGIAVEDIRFIERTNFPLTVAVVPGQQLILKVNYDGDRFSRTAAHALMRRFHHLAMAMIEENARPIGRLSAVTDDERKLLLGAWATRPGPALGPESAHAAFERHALARPDAVAVDDGSEVRTYAALDRDANRMAHRLRQAGVGRETIVGLFLPRSIDFVTTMLGVLKAGGAWLPLDPEYPAALLLEMLADSGVRHVVCRGAPPALAQAVDVLIDLDTESKNAAAPGFDGAPLDMSSAVAIAPEQLAYVIYTSGSTGKPKGVLVPHAGVANNAYQHAIAQGVEAESRVYQFASPSFDASVAEIFTTFMAGATLCLPSASALAARDPIASIREARITHLTIPPSLAAVLVPADVPHLRCLTLAGEAGTGELFRRWSAHCRVINAYGPTESTVCATLEDCTDLAGEPVLGWPMPGKRIFLIDEWGDLVPPGVAGEIAIGGLGTARGYHARRSLTAAAFVPNPFGGEPGALLYRTGDMGVRLADGRIRYAGRIDRQIKLRGFRLELGELEAILGAQPGVRQAVARLCRPEGQAAQLVAYVEVDASRYDEDSLLAALAVHLPPHARPSRIVVVSAWPRLPNGKIAIDALPLPVEAPRPSIVPTSTLSAAEQLLVDIWSHVLHRPVGSHDNFFHLGGDSIASLQIVARARDAGLTLTPRQIFEHPRVAELAAHVTLAPAAWTPPEPYRGSVPLSPIQRWFFRRALPDQAHWNQSVTLALSEHLDAGSLTRAFMAVCARHDAFRFRVSENRGAWEQHYAPEATPAIHVFDLTHLDRVAAHEAMESLADRVQGSFDLERGPVCASALFRLPGGEPDRLLITAHHLVIDVVSWRYVLEDFLHALDGQALPAWQGTSFRRWSERLEEAARNGFFADELPYWQQVLAAPPVTFPERSNGHAQTGPGIHLARLDRERTGLLLAGGSARARDLVLTALVDALHTVAGASDLCVDIESHGRTSPWEDMDVAATVGWFTAFYPVRLTRAATADARTRLEAVVRALAEVPRQGLGFGVLSQLPPAPDQVAALAHAPPRQIGFNYLGELDAAGSLPRGYALLEATLGRDSTPDQRPAHPLEVDASIVGGLLRMVWRFDPHVLDPAWIATLADAHHQALTALLGLLPAFDKIMLDEQDLASILAELSE